MRNEYGPIIHTFFRSARTAWFTFVAFVAIIVIVPGTLWFSWKYYSNPARLIAELLFCGSFAWVNISLLRWQWCLRNLGVTTQSKLIYGLGPRPEDPDEFILWNRGIQVRYSFVALLLTMAAFGLVLWLNGE
jgi:hypothetical protein